MMNYNYKSCFRKSVPLLLFLFTICCGLTAQNYPSDCFEAYPICNLGDYHFSNIRGAGSLEELQVNKSMIRETNSIWLQFTAENEGELEFVIIPDSAEDDIDFVLYEGEKCTDVNPLRVMTSGQIIGDENAQYCVGQTGLRNNADDTKENDGCFDTDDNFLKTALLETGKKYYLFINNFNSAKGFTILFSEDGNLKLEDNCNNAPSFVEFNLYPNPAIDKVTLSSETKINESVEITVMDLSGRIMSKQTIENMMDDMQIDVADIPSGEYYLQIVSEKYRGLKSLVKI